MNYHFMIDEKFIDGFIKSAEELCPFGNIYIFDTPTPAKFVRYSGGIYAKPGTDEFEEIAKKIKLEDRVYIHWYNESAQLLIKRIPREVPIYLFFWGGDFLGQTKELQDFNLDVETKKYFKRTQQSVIRYFPKNPFGYLRNVTKYLQQQKMHLANLESQQKLRQVFLERLNYFCHWNQLDLEIVQKYYGGHPTFLNFFYDVSLDKTHKIENSISSLKNVLTIWLGNSDVITNNHLDALKSIKKYSKEKIEVVCPLNYEKDSYTTKIDMTGRSYFGSNWTPILDFVNIEEYLIMLQTVDVVVMYHNRSQAAGNIFAFIKMGKKVFLKKQSTIYTLLKNNGVLVFDSNLISRMSFSEFSQPLSSDEVASNISLISNMFSEDNRVKYLSSILN